MNDARMNELDGRIEALAELLLEVTEELDNAGYIEINDISATLRRNADNKPFPPSTAESAPRSLRLLADELQRRNRTLVDR